MFNRFIFFIFMVCIGTSIYAAKIVDVTPIDMSQELNPAKNQLNHGTPPIIQVDTYKTKDILLLFKSCYETLYFLGNTKYKGKRKPLTEEKVSKQCFCICDKIRKKYSPETFLNRQSRVLQKIITPLSNECIQDLGPFWENNIEDE